MNEQVYEQMNKLLGHSLFNVIMNPRTDRPYIFSSFKKRRVYTTLSSGEKALVNLAYDIYNGSGKSKLTDLGCLDADSRIRVLNCIQTLLLPRL